MSIQPPASCLDPIGPPSMRAEVGSYAAMTVDAVFCDGARLDVVVRFDAAEGWADTTEVDGEGLVRLDGRQNWVMVRHHGVITIRLKPSAKRPHVRDRLERTGCGWLLAPELQQPEDDADAPDSDRGRATA